MTHRRLPHILALAAVISLLPALKVGMLGDDLIQRLCQYRPEQLPPRIIDTGFVAVGAYGVIAAFLVHLGNGRYRETPGLLTRWVPAGIALLLVFVHVPGALAARALMGHFSPDLPVHARKLFAFRRVPAFGERQVVVVNDPTLMGVFSPFELAYQGKPVPVGMQVLAAGFSSVRITRPNANTLVLESRSTDLFACPDLRPLHVVYALRSCNEYLFGKTVWKTGDRVVRKGLVIEVLKLSPSGVPKSVACIFDKNLDSEEMLWIYFDFRFWVHLPFPLPAIGSAVEVSGAGALAVPNAQQEADAVGERSN